MSAVSAFKQKRGESKFQAALRESVALKRELDKLGARESLKLTPDAYLKMALDNAGQDRETIARVRDELNQRPSLQYGHGFVSKARDICRDVCLEPPHADLDRQAPSGGLPMVISDCLQLPSKPSLLELVAVAVLDLVGNEPECFGENSTTVADAEAHQTKLSARMDELVQSLPDLAQQAGQLVIELAPHNPNTEGRQVFVRYRDSGIDFHQGPEALIDWALDSSNY